MPLKAPQMRSEGDQKRQQQYMPHALAKNVQLPKRVQKVDERASHALAAGQSV